MALGTAEAPADVQQGVAQHRAVLQDRGVQGGMRQEGVEEVLVVGVGVRIDLLQIESEEHQGPIGGAHIEEPVV